jgi:hypothetical protein
MLPTRSSRRWTLATQPDDNEQIVPSTIRQIITAPVATQQSRGTLLYGAAAAFAAFAPLPFGAIAAALVAILAAERKK